MDKGSTMDDNGGQLDDMGERTVYVSAVEGKLTSEHLEKTFMSKESVLRPIKMQFKPGDQWATCLFDSVRMVQFTIWTLNSTPPCNMFATFIQPQLLKPLPPPPELNNSIPFQSPCTAEKLPQRARRPKYSTKPVIFGGLPESEAWPIRKCAVCGLMTGLMCETCSSYLCSLDCARKHTDVCKSNA